MATIVFSVIGSAIGGPIGGAIGAVIGQQVDRKLLAPKGREGPRLNDLKVQTSSYGNVIPKVFGTMRLSGTVIWSTDLKETRSRVSGGKRQSKSTQYSYSASFAVALSARPVARIGRIWADGKLLRGEAGDFKTPTGFRLHNGTAAQAADPLIAAVEGMGNTPAYRGMAYAVFEDFQLAEYGNRIPSLSFEIIGDEGGTSVQSILSALTGDSVVVSAVTGLGGYAAYGGSLAGVIAGLSEAISLRARDDGNNLLIEQQPPSPFDLTERPLGAGYDGQGKERLRIDHKSDERVASRLSLAYSDASRDYQPGRQHARREAILRRDEEIELPATLDAVGARNIAEQQLKIRLAGRRTARVSLPWRYTFLVPGQTIRIAGRSETWMIESTAFERMVVHLSLARLPAASASLPAAEPGRGVGEADLVHGPTVVRLVDLPPVGDGARNSPHVVVAAAGLSAGWRRAGLLMSLDDGASWQEAGDTAAPATMGNVTATVAAGQTSFLDNRQVIEVDLLNSSMELVSSNLSALLAGTNAAMVGEELIQFMNAQEIAPGRYRLTGLLRGRRGTEAKAIPAGAPFTLIETGSLLPLEVPVDTALVRVLAQGVGDPVSGSGAELVVPGATIKPLTPVHLATEVQADGAIRVTWIRRSRDGWRWIDAVNAPLAEESERYDVTLTPNSGSPRTIGVSSPELLYTTAEKAADVAAGANQITIKVAQRGTFAVSRPSQISIPLV